MTRSVGDVANELRLYKCETWSDHSIQGLASTLLDNERITNAISGRANVSHSFYDVQLTNDIYSTIVALTDNRAVSIIEGKSGIFRKKIFVNSLYVYWTDLAEFVRNDRFIGFRGYPNTSSCYVLFQGSEEINKKF